MRIDEIFGKKSKRRGVLESVNIVQFKKPVEEDIMQEIIDLMKKRTPMWKKEMNVVFKVIDNTSFQYSIYAEDDSPMSNARVRELTRLMSKNLIQILDMFDIKDNLKQISVDFETNELDDGGYMTVKA